MAEGGHGVERYGPSASCETDRQTDGLEVNGGLLIEEMIEEGRWHDGRALHCMHMLQKQTQ